jgi:hypothetical protein
MPSQPDDEYADLPISNQAKWQRRNRDKAREMHQRWRKSPAGKAASKRYAAKKKKNGENQTAWIKFRQSFLEGKSDNEGNFECQICGRLIKVPHLHHIQERNIRPDLIYDSTNIEILCASCHMRTHYPNSRPDYKLKSDLDKLNI